MVVGEDVQLLVVHREEELGGDRGGQTEMAESDQDMENSWAFELNGKLAEVKEDVARREYKVQSLNSGEREAGGAGAGDEDVGGAGAGDGDVEGAGDGEGDVGGARAGEGDAGGVGTGEEVGDGRCRQGGDGVERTRESSQRIGS